MTSPKDAANSDPQDTDQPASASERDADSAASADLLPLDAPEGDELEFSLEQLSQAYAKVIRSQAGANGEESSATSSGSDPASVRSTSSRPSSSSEDEDELDVLSSEPLDPVELDDRRDDAPCRITETTVLESILFVGAPPDVPLTARQLAGMMRDISPKEIPGLVKQLNEQYEQQAAAYRIVMQDKAYQLVVTDDLKTIRDAFYGEVRSAQLTQQAIEVLAVVAYNQPISRSQIDKIRQRPSGGVLGQLCERQLLAVDPQSESTRDRLYITTERFLQLFGLGEIGDLPQAQEVDNIDEFFG